MNDLLFPERLSKLESPQKGIWSHEPLQKSIVTDCIIACCDMFIELSMPALNGGHFYCLHIC